MIQREPPKMTAEDDVTTPRKTHYITCFGEGVADPYVITQPVVAYRRIGHASPGVIVQKVAVYGAQIVLLR